MAMHRRQGTTGASGGNSGRQGVRRLTPKALSCPPLSEREPIPSGQEGRGRVARLSS